MTVGAHGAPVPGTGGVVVRVAEGGPASRAGVVPGDEIVAVDGRRIRDVIDWRWLTADGAFTARVARADGSVDDVSVDAAWGESAGVEFAAPLFDHVRECDNACEFCFVAQLPPGLRASLYVRDDDYRLSFLAGSFVTLTNLDDDDVDRILEQRLSPLRVSLHAVDVDVRRSLVCPAGEDRALEVADRLLAGGIQLHVQVVLVPGRNDGEVLERTLTWLAERRGIASVGVVPVGFTRFQRRYTESYAAEGPAREVLAALAPWQRRMEAERGLPWVYAADELYLAAHAAVPPATDYGGFPQYDNGIGMVRSFTDAWLAEAAAAGGGPEPISATLVTGELFAPVLAGLARRATGRGVDARVLAVRNAFLGGNVSVAGLLTGEDVAAAVRADGASGTYLVPRVMFNADGLTLDDATPSGIRELCGAAVRVVSSDAPEPIAAIRSAAAGEGG